MSSGKVPLLTDGLFALGSLLPSGYALSTSGLGRRRRSDETWVVLRGPARKHLTCLVLARRRVEPRDLDNIAAGAARSGRPALVVSTFLSPTVRQRLHGLGIGCWDLTGNARIVLPSVDLHLDRDTDASAQGKSEHHRRSLAGAAAGRVARVLVDVSPPFSLSQVAQLAGVDASCAARVIAFLVKAGIVVRRPRGMVEKVDWQTLLRRWSWDAPLAARGTLCRTRYARGVPAFLTRLAASGLLHALTGRHAFTLLAAVPAPGVAVLYVDDVPDAVAQFGLHPVAGEANVILVKPADRSVYQRSREETGLRHVSPSLMVADLDEHDAVDATMLWLARHESKWRASVSALLSPRKTPRPDKAVRGGLSAPQARPRSSRT
jgi:hypothetical protein